MVWNQSFCSHDIFTGACFAPQKVLFHQLAMLFPALLVQSVTLVSVLPAHLLTAVSAAGTFVEKKHFVAVSEDGHTWQRATR